MVHAGASGGCNGLGRSFCTGGSCQGVPTVGSAGYFVLTSDSGRRAWSQRGGLGCTMSRSLDGMLKSWGNGTWLAGLSSGALVMVHSGCHCDRGRVFPRPPEECLGGGSGSCTRGLPPGMAGLLSVGVAYWGSCGAGGLLALLSHSNPWEWRWHLFSEHTEAAGLSSHSCSNSSVSFRAESPLGDVF